jgi:hypothetical protein
MSKLSLRLDAANVENVKLRETVRDYERIEKVLGREQTEAILQRAKAMESLDKPKTVPRKKTGVER